VKRPHYAWAFGALLTGGCVNGVGPNYKAPEAPPLTAFSEMSARATAASPPPTWWRLLKDAVLDDLVQRTFTANQTIATAEANLRAARAAYRVQSADLYPTIAASAQYTRERLSAAGQGLPGVLPDEDFYDGRFDATWEIDIFGRVRREVEQARAQSEAAAAQLDDARVSLAAETVRAYVDLRGAQVRLDVARSNAENQQRTYDLTVRLSEGGRGSDVDIVRAQAQLETTLASISTIETEETAAKYELAVLTGATPESLTETFASHQPIPELPESIAIGDPAAMLRRRPDVRAAERLLEATTAQVGVATADLFPRVTFNGVVGVSAFGFSRLGDQGAFQYGFGPSLSWSFLDIGRVRGRIQQANALAAAQLASYEATVLAALEDAETALNRFTRERERLLHLTTAAAGNARAAELTQQRYEAGIDSFLNVLDAERSLLASQDALAQSQILLTEQFVAIYKALGAGWEDQAATQRVSARSEPEKP
jgi:multidrug efflux system outer membrane protein